MEKLKEVEELVFKEPPNVKLKKVDVEGYTGLVGMLVEERESESVVVVPLEDDNDNRWDEYWLIENESLENI